MSEDVAGSLIDALTGEGQHVDDGSFTLDPTKARDKLRDHQLAEPLAYVLLLVEAATLAGSGRADATPRIAFTLATTSEARFAGVRWRDDELRNPFAAVFCSVPDEPDAARRVRVLQLLALAANAALAAGAERVEIEAAGDDGRLRRVTLVPEREVEPRFESLAEPAGGVCFRFVGGAFEFGRAGKERDLLVQHCELSTTAISVDGERIDVGFGAAFAGFRRLETTQIVMDEFGIIGQAGRVGAEPARAMILTRGVLTETLPLPDCRPGFVAVVDVDLRKDLSQRQLLRDQTFTSVVAAIMRADERLPWAGARVEPRPTHDEDSVTAKVAVLLLVLAFVLIFVIALLRG